MSRKMESFSVPELVEMFATKWKLDVVPSLDKATKLPVIVNDPAGYRIYFKGAVNKFSYDKLTKSMLIKPDRYLSKYRLNQIVAASKGEYHECQQS